MPTVRVKGLSRQDLEVIAIACGLGDPWGRLEQTVMDYTMTIVRHCAVVADYPDDDGCTPGQRVLNEFTFYDEAPDR